ncbi:MAG: Dabb family protein [Oscillospiraceae bacterium]|nr:Dabb family protein [Oscillospiraceae bacterium]
MIRHTVCFKLSDGSEESKNRAKEVLMSMEGNVPTIRKIWVGTDFLMSERSYDVILQVDLESREALDEYQNDPYHCSVVKTYMHANREASIAIDCEL